MEPDDKDPEQTDQLAELQKIAAAFAEGIETKLSTRLDEAIEGINAKIAGNAAAYIALQEKAQTAFETLPQVIKKSVEDELKVNMKGVVDELSKQFEGKMKAMLSGKPEEGEGNGVGVGFGLNLNSLLSHSEQIIGIVNAFRAPTTEQAMLGEMDRVFRWHSLLSKLEKGGGSSEELTKQIAGTFETKKQG